MWFEFGLYLWAVDNDLYMCQLVRINANHSLVYYLAHSNIQQYVIQIPSGVGQNNFSFKIFTRRRDDPVIPTDFCKIDVKRMSFTIFSTALPFPDFFTHFSLHLFGVGSGTATFASCRVTLFLTPENKVTLTI